MKKRRALEPNRTMEERTALVLLRIVEVAVVISLIVITAEYLCGLRVA